MRWLKDIGKDVREMKFTGWRQQAVEREEWTSVIKGAKAVSGP
jgi:hypothetical protein